MRSHLWLVSSLLATTLLAPALAQTPAKVTTSNTPITDQFKIPPFRDYTGDGVQNLDDIPAHQKNYNDLLKKWAARISGTGT
ncbi:hypothetical protein [Gloeomargarita lithophora]|uniref:hypothetical protein n=1 Tax=Gloeomargarita lithophora TaxID=1188228 RepID=UPI0012FD4772|nr:hypothetical protein [Gloeomargarita lithophora]